MNRRDFLAKSACFAALVPFAHVTMLDRKDKPKAQSPADPKKVLPYFDTPPEYRNNRIQRYRRYEKMLEDPEVERMVREVCDAACKPSEMLDYQVTANFGYGTAKWRHEFHDFWVYAPDVQKNHRFRFAQKIPGITVLYGENPTTPSPHMDYSDRKLDRDGFWDFEELVFLYWGILDAHHNLPKWAWSLAVYGDLFLEPVCNPERPQDGVLRTTALPADTMYRIETTKGDLVEFQQSREGPDYMALMPKSFQKGYVSTAVRWKPDDLVHCRLPNMNAMPDNKRLDGFYPYGTSVLEYLNPNGLLQLGKHNCWLVNLVRNSLLNGLTALGNRHLAARNEQFDFCIL